MKHLQKNQRRERIIHTKESGKSLWKNSPLICVLLNADAEMVQEGTVSNGGIMSEFNIWHHAIPSKMWEERLLNQRNRETYSSQTVSLDIVQSLHIF